MNLKHGDRVTCKINGVQINDARISIDEHGCYFICQNRKKGEKAKIFFGYRYSWFFDPEDMKEDGVSDLRIVKEPRTENPRTILSEPLREGDVLYRENGDEQRKILGVCGQAVFPSHINLFDSAGQVWTAIDLASNGWTLKQPEPPKPRTLLKGER